VVHPSIEDIVDQKYRHCGADSVERQNRR
jgi:hypothetical protein